MGEVVVRVPLRRFGCGVCGPGVGAVEVYRLESGPLRGQYGIFVPGAWQVAWPGSDKRLPAAEAICPAGHRGEDLVSELLAAAEGDSR